MSLKFLALLFVSVCLVWVAGCSKHKAPSTDAEDNTFYSMYRDIYRAYNKIPLDSTNIQLKNYLARFPENTDAWAFYGNTLFRLGQDKDAALAYHKAIDGDNEKGIYYSGLGTVLNAENELDSSEKYLLKALALKDSSPYTTLNLSMLYLKQNNKEKSLAFADSTLHRAPSSAAVLAGLSFVYFALNEPQTGNEKYSLAVQNGLKDTAAFTNVLNGKMKIEDYYRINSN
jgi:Tfp pilus assembly protein PilF